MWNDVIFCLAMLIILGMIPLRGYIFRKIDEHFSDENERLKTQEDDIA